MGGGVARGGGSFADGEWGGALRGLGHGYGDILPYRVATGAYGISIEDVYPLLGGASSCRDLSGLCRG